MSTWMICRHGGTGLGLGIVKSLVQIMGGNIRIVEKIGQGSLFQFTIAFQRSLKIERGPFLLPSSLQGAEVVLGIPEADCRSVVARWVKSWGLVAHQCDTWDEILLHMRALNGILADQRKGPSGLTQRYNAESVQASTLALEGGAKSPRASVPKWSSRYEFWKSWKNIGSKALSGHERQLLIIDISLLPSIVEHDYLEEYLRQAGFLTGNSAVCLDALGLEKLDLNERQLTNIQRNLLVIWVTASNTPEPVKAALRSVRNSITVRRPLHSARLKELFQQIAREGGDPLPITESDRPRILSSNALAYAKQQEWDDPYRCDSEVSSAGPVKPELSLSSLLPITTSEQAAKVILTPILPEVSNLVQDASPPPTIRPLINFQRSRQPKKNKTLVRAMPKPLEKLEIMVAEDTPLLRKLAVAMLRKLGACTHEAANGREVLTAVVNRMNNGQPPFNCILMDCQVSS